MCPILRDLDPTTGPIFANSSLNVDSPPTIPASGLSHPATDVKKEKETIENENTTTRNIEDDIRTVNVNGNNVEVTTMAKKVDGDNDTENTELGSGLESTTESREDDSKVEEDEITTTKSEKDTL